MVRLTLDLIARGTSRHTRKKRDENVHQFVRRLTHLYLENKNIDEVGDDLSLCRSLNVLYMYDNHLGHIPSLSGSCALTHLYLQNNNISKIENLASLTRIQKLFLGGNAITVLEGLESLTQLQELHVENQQQPNGEHLLLDPRSLAGISETLQVLNISGNNLSSLSELQVLSKLTTLMAINNLLSDMKELTCLLSTWRFLLRLDLTGNPLCQVAKYKDHIILVGTNLEVLDGKTIRSTERQFLISWQAVRDIQSKRLQNNLLRQDTCSSISSEAAGGRNLPPVLSASKYRTALPTNILPGRLHQQFGEVLDKYSVPQHSRSNQIHGGSVQTNYADAPEVQANGPGFMLHRDATRHRPLSVEHGILKHSAHRRRL